MLLPGVGALGRRRLVLGALHQLGRGRGHRPRQEEPGGHAAAQAFPVGTGLRLTCASSTMATWRFPSRATAGPFASTAASKTETITPPSSAWGSSPKRSEEHP